MKRVSVVGVLAMVVALAGSACAPPPPPTTPTSSWQELCTPTDAFWDRIDVAILSAPVGSSFSYTTHTGDPDNPTEGLSMGYPNIVGFSISPPKQGRCIRIRTYGGVTYQLTPVQATDLGQWLIDEQQRFGWPPGWTGPDPLELGEAPGDVVGLTGAISVESGGPHTCALNGDNTVSCWGRNDEGQLGDGTTTGRATPVTVAGLTDVTALALGSKSTCALKSDGTVRCWGDNLYGQLGDGTLTDSLAPVPVSGITDAVQLSGESDHMCAVLAGGSIECWGEDRSATFGNGTSDPVVFSTPVPAASGLTDVAYLDSGGRHACAVLTSGSIKCWGASGDGQIGDGVVPGGNYRPTPTDVIGITDAVDVSAGGYHTCATLGDGSVRCWGRNSSGELGNGGAASTATPTPVTDLTDAVEVAVGSGVSCTRLIDGGVDCWGEGSSGALGYPGGANSALPVPVPTVTGATDLATESTHACAVIGGGAVRCWGTNYDNTLGRG